MNITIKTQDGNRIEHFALRLSTTIQDIKQRLWEFTNRPPYEQCIIYRGHILDNDWDMNVAGITDGATIQLMFHNGSIPSEGHRPPTAKDADKHVLNSVVVHIEEQGGKTLGQYRTTEVNLIYHLKKQIERDKSIPFTHQKLFLGDLELQNGRKLKYYKIESGAKLTLRQEKSEPKEPSYERGEATIFIRTLTGKTISIPEISIERLTVDTMKQIIAGKVGMEPGEMRLIFGSKQIEDGRTLGEDYGVGNGSTLHLVQRLEGGVGMASK